MKKQYYVIISLFVVILGLAFYWYEYRPQKIRKDCYKRAQNFYVSAAEEVASNKSVEEIQNNLYVDCLMWSGLK